MSWPVVLVHCFNYRDDKASRDTIVCDSYSTADHWKTLYMESGWRSCWISGWMKVETLPPKGS